jgi:Mor family transcriptional regulator
MLIVETICKVRQARFRDGKAIRGICREFNLTRNTVRNIIRSGVTDQAYEHSTNPVPSSAALLSDYQRC